MRDVLKAEGNDCELYEVEDKHNTHSFYTAGCFMLKADQNSSKVISISKELSLFSAERSIFFSFGVM